MSERTTPLVKLDGVAVGRGRTFDFHGTAITSITVTDSEADITIDAGGGTPSGTVTDETTFGIAPAAGVGTDYSRADHTHGSPTDPVTAHAAAGDPHSGYRLESADHTHQSTGAQAGTLDHGLALTGLTDDDHTQYILHAIANAEGDLLLASAADTFTRLGIGGNGTVLSSNGTTASWQAPGAASHPGFVNHNKYGTD